MILYASQRANAAELAKHLLNTKENDHVTVHEIRGFVSDDLAEALREAHAISRGTRCRQFLFSVSLNPPEYADVPIEAFEAAIEDIERKLSLIGQPRIIVFHEKKGRRHCHVVWSRIDAAKLVAINMAHFKRKLMEVAHGLFLRHGWKLPKGMQKHEKRSPWHLTREEYRQAVRLAEDPQTLKAMLKGAWEQSDTKETFLRALEERGFLLAKGDRRGYVLLDVTGGVYSLTRWLDIGTRDLKARLGKPDSLPDIGAAQEFLASRLNENLNRYMTEAKTRAKAARLPLVREIRALVTVQRQERDVLVKSQQTRWVQESRQRVARLPKGFKGIWHKATGDYAKVIAQNTQETKLSLARDRKELHQLVRRQLKERQELQKSVLTYQEEEKREALRIRQEIARYVSTATEPFIPQKPAEPASDKPPLVVQLEQLETKIALLSGDINQLQASLESNVLSEEMRARIRQMIERTLETLHIKAIEEKQQLTRTEARQKDVERKQIELSQYIRHYAEIQHKLEVQQRKQDANRQFYAVVTHMSYSLNGLPRWDIRVQSPPQEKQLNEKAYVGRIQQLKNRELLHTITTTERPKPIIEPEIAAPNLRQSVLEAKEIMRRAGLQPGGDDSRSIAPVRIKITDTAALSTRFTQRRQ
jgi:hypothetical protein